MVNDEPSMQELVKLWNICSDFINNQRIWGAESVYQVDRVIENAYEFIHEICETVGYIELEDE